MRAVFGFVRPTFVKTAKEALLALLEAWSEDDTRRWELPLRRRLPARFRIVTIEDEQVILADETDGDDDPPATVAGRLLEHVRFGTFVFSRRAGTSHPLRGAARGDPRAHHGAVRRRRTHGGPCRPHPPGGHRSLVRVASIAALQTTASDELLRRAVRRAGHEPARDQPPLVFV